MGYLQTFSTVKPYSRITTARGRCAKAIHPDHGDLGTD